MPISDNPDYDEWEYNDYDCPMTIRADYVIKCTCGWLATADTFVGAESAVHAHQAEEHPILESTGGGF